MSPLSDAQGSARRTLGRVRRKAGTILDGRRDTADARIEKSLGQLRDRLGKQFDRMHTDVNQLASRMNDLEKHSAGLEKSLADLSRRPPPPPPPRSPPKPLGVQVLEDSVVLSGLSFTGPRPRVVLVLQNFGMQMLFAGVRTAMITAVELSRRTGRPLALVVLEPLLADPDQVREGLAKWLADELGAADVAGDLTVSAPENIRRRDAHPGDIWVATFWTTAYQLGRLCDAGAIDHRQVVYLVQDWEPGFYAWGTEHALAGSTYDLGFQFLVNSASLADYVAERTGRPIDPKQVIAPQVDEAHLRAATEAWVPGEEDRPRVLFYARPSKPRNLYALGLAALREWAEELPASVRPIVTFAGEEIAVAPDLGPGMTVEVVGKVDMAAYYDLLSHTDLGLALMHSPHPSHLALEMPMTGIPTVTNAVEDHRKPWVPGLDVVAATPKAIAAALAANAGKSRGVQSHDFVPLGDSLGLPLEICLDALVSRLPAAVRTPTEDN